LSDFFTFFGAFFLQFFALKFWFILVHFLGSAKKMAFVGTINRYFFYIFATTNLKQNAMNAKTTIFCACFGGAFRYIVQRNEVDARREKPLALLQRLKR